MVRTPHMQTINQPKIASPFAIADSCSGNTGDYKAVDLYRYVHPKKIEDPHMGNFMSLLSPFTLRDNIKKPKLIFSKFGRHAVLKFTIICELSFCQYI